MDLSEVVWRKAFRSHDDGDACVEIASSAKFIAIRDSKDPDGPKVVVSHNDFRSFARVVKNL
ncbi:DUF397 domain-containing protein [Actinomadura formosensis]|uniref:DUF397 domain-containing protein n=1 Tax=Actinomadura formosensis TaxID=60706 RepID=UPI003D91E11D